MSGRRVNPVKVGAFVVGGLVILVGAVMVIGSGRMFRRTHPFVSYFDGSVNGLRAGAPVKFKGVEIGKVDSIRIPGGLTPTDQPIAVIFSLDGNKLEASGNRAGGMPKFLKGAIENGLRAQLETDSLVTGVLFVSLSFAPDAPAHLHEPLDGVMEIPTIPLPLQEIGAGIRSIVDRIDAYPFERVFDSLRESLDAFTEFSRAPEIHSAFTSLDKTLQDLDAAVLDFRQKFDPLCARMETLLARGDALGSDLQLGVSDGRAAMTSVQTLTDQLSVALPPLARNLEATSSRLEAMAGTVQAMLESARVVLDPHAPLAVELRAGFREVGEAARALRALLELLERSPSALVRGKGANAGESR
jgi:paraquat-inducible protein B